MPDLRVRQLPMPRSRALPPRLRPTAAGSAAVHLLLLALLLFMKPAGEPFEPPAAPSFAVEFTDGAGNPSPPVAASQPQMNIPMMQMEPPPDERAEPMPEPVRRPRFTQPNPSTRADRNPFAHIVPFDLSPRAREANRSGSPTSRGLDLSAGPVVANGQIRDSVQHVVGQHGYSDYMQVLHDFVESKIYYPQQAADNGEEGVAVARITITRDGHVKDVQLLTSSGSHLLDDAWLSVFRNYRMPPFDDNLTQPEITTTVSLEYDLIHRRF